MSDAPTYSRADRDFGTGHDMMHRIEELEAEMREHKFTAEHTSGEWRATQDDITKLRDRLRIANGIIEDGRLGQAANSERKLWELAQICRVFLEDVEEATASMRKLIEEIDDFEADD